MHLIAPSILTLSLSPIPRFSTLSLLLSRVEKVGYACMVEKKKADPASTAQPIDYQIVGSPKQTRGFDCF
jgi:hypothetical protein